MTRGAVVYLPGAVNRRAVEDVLAHAQLHLAGVLTWFKPDPKPVVWAVGRGHHTRAPDGAVHALEPPAGNAAVAGHPCPKPQHLMRFLVEAATSPAGIVLDPFTGTGTTLVAARQAGRSAVGIEIDGRYCAVARRRVQRSDGCEPDIERRFACVT